MNAKEWRALLLDISAEGDERMAEVLAALEQRVEEHQDRIENDHSEAIHDIATRLTAMEETWRQTLDKWCETHPHPHNPAPAEERGDELRAAQLEARLQSERAERAEAELATAHAHESDGWKESKRAYRERDAALADAAKRKELLVKVDMALRGALVWAGVHWGEPSSVEWVLDGAIEAIRQRDSFKSDAATARGECSRVLDAAIEWVRLHVSGLSAPNEEDLREMREWMTDRAALSSSPPPATGEDDFSDPAYHISEWEKLHGEYATQEPRGVLMEVVDQRYRHAQEWGGPNHDDKHGPMDWLRYIGKQMDKAASEWGRGDDRGYRERLIRIAALAIDATESWDRRAAATPPQPSPEKCRNGKDHEWTSDDAGVTFCHNCGIGKSAKPSPEKAQRYTYTGPGGKDPCSCEEGKPPEPGCPDHSPEKGQGEKP